MHRHPPHPLVPNMHLNANADHLGMLDLADPSIATTGLPDEDLFWLNRTTGQAEAVATGAERIIVLPTGYSCNAPMQSARPGPIGVGPRGIPQRSPPRRRHRCHPPLRRQNGRQRGQGNGSDRDPVGASGTPTLAATPQ